jgi:uncharacterized protein YwgA
MNRLEKDAVLAHLITALRNKGSWCGETHIQKCAFFLEELTERPLGFNFILYKHGPYSFDLTDELASMRAFGYLNWEVLSTQFGPRLKATADKSKLSEYAAEVEKLKPALDFIVSKLSQLGVASLERFSTALFFTSKDKIEDVEARAQKICAVKPHIPIEKAREAVFTVEEILKEWAAAKVEPKLVAV